jgi:tripeptide aminopeptidase
VNAPADVVDEVVRRTLELGAIPAPPMHEAKRAAVVERWWRDDGLGSVHRDATGNVWAGAVPGEGPGTVVAAHLDTVFSTEVRHRPRVEGGRMIGPSVGDDSVGVAALSSVARLLPSRASRPVWLLSTVCEEGIGDLAGITGALREFPDRFDALIAVEGNYLGRVCRTAVGSTRWRVEYRGPGGHAWERSDAPNALHALSRAVTSLVDLPLPDGVRSSINVGRMGGGEAINARAARAWLELDLRSEDGATLHELAAGARRVLEQEAGSGLDVTFEALGRRPAGAIDAGHALVRAAVAALRSVALPADLTSASTDANAALAAAIPAVTVGVTRGEGEHTVDEWIELAPLAVGLAALARTISLYDRGPR